MVFPHVVGDMLSQANSFSGDAQAAEAIERGEPRANIRPKRLSVLDPENIWSFCPRLFLRLLSGEPFIVAPLTTLE